MALLATREMPVFLELIRITFWMTVSDDHAIGFLLKIKKRHYFLSADKSKMMIYVSASASTQHIKAPINTNNNLPDS
jgi:hypothetical protein